MKPTPKPLRIAILGCGAAARLHAKILKRKAHVQLWFASRDQARATAYRSEFGGAGDFGSYDTAIASDVDAVLVTTPTVSHAALTLQALRHGKHVVVEKPAFMRAADALEVQSAALSAGRQVMVAENYFYKPVAEFLRQTIRSGTLGEIRFVTMNAIKKQRGEGWRSDPSLSGGNALFEGGVHWVSFAANIGLDVASVHGYQTGGKNSSVVVFRYTNGAIGTLNYSWEIPAPLGGLRMSKVFGTRGAVSFESNGLVIFGSGGARTFRIPAFSDPVGYGAMWTDFLHALDTGASPRFALEMAYRDLQMLEVIGGSDIY